MTASSAMKNFGLFSLRFFEFGSAVVVLGTLGYTVHGYHFHGSKRTNFVLAQAAISTFYSLCTCLLTLAVPQLIFVGLYWFWELIMTMLWLAAFIVDAKVQGDHGCHNRRSTTYEPHRGSQEEFQATNGEYNPFTGKYTTNDYKRPCHTGKASIAFAGLCFVLYLTSTIILGVRVMTPIVKKYGSKGLMMKGSDMNDNSLNRFHGLDLVKPLDDAYNYDPEQGMGETAPQDSASSHEYNQEKLNEQPRASGDTAVQAQT